MEPIVSLPCWQEHIFGPYDESVESTPLPPIKLHPYGSHSRLARSSKWVPFFRVS